MVKCLSKNLALTALFVATLAVAAMAAGRLPASAKPLAEIASALEQSGYLIVDVEFDDGLWQADAYQNNASYELHIDPVSGKILSTHADNADPAPSAGAMKLSSVLKEVNKSGYSPIVSAEFKHGRWEVEAYKNNFKCELQVEPEHAKIIADRVDD